MLNKIDFALILNVSNANPNGDPLNGNRPRTDYNGFGEISDVCLKRKLRDRLLESGESIFVQSDDRKVDDMRSLKDRAIDEKVGLGKDAFDQKKTTTDEFRKLACAKWYDVRAFGQLYAFKGESVSIGIRGPVAIQSAFSVTPVELTETQITKSVNSVGSGDKKDSDTMGMKYRVDKGVYVTYGSITPQLASITGFDEADAEKLKNALTKIFENDSSSARPSGSMGVMKLIWWKHNCPAGQYSSYKVHSSLKVNPDGTYAIDSSNTPGLAVEEIDGF